MNTLLDILYFEVFTAFGLPVSLLEILGFVTGALCVWAVAQQWVWNWPLAIANAVFFALLFFNTGLYADAFLQVIFFALSIYGWYKWTHGKPDNADKLPVRNARGAETILLSVLFVVATAVVTAFLITQTDSDVAVFDALILTGSVLATYGQAKKIIQTWWVWIAVDVISIPLHLYKGLALTAVLYVIFLALCILGLINWKRDFKAQKQSALLGVVSPSRLVYTTESKADNDH